MARKNVEAAGCAPESMAHAPSSHLSTTNNYSAFIGLSLPMVVRRDLPRTIHRCARAVHHSHSLRPQLPRVIQSRDLHHFQSHDTPSAKDTNPRTKRYPLFACLIEELSLDIRAWARWLTHKMQPASARLLFTLHVPPILVFAWAVLSLILADRGLLALKNIIILILLIVHLSVGENRPSFNPILPSSPFAL